jgi:tetratricopeptide (TPR) repeat protein
MPEYRKDEDAIDINIKLGKSSGRMKDNFITLEIEESNPDDAYRIASQELDNFLKHLTLSQGVSFSYTPLFFESENGDLFPVPKYVEFMKVTAYNIEKLKKNILDAQEFLRLNDPKLDKALQYLEQAIILNNEQNNIAPIFSRNHGQIVTSIFLNLWKSISIVVGDPSIDSDYQSRYKKLGFDYEYFQTKIEWIRELRNNYDVAHYSISEEEIEQIKENYGKAQNIVVEVLQRYREVLMAS